MGHTAHTMRRTGTQSYDQLKWVKMGDGVAPMGHLAPLPPRGGEGLGPHPCLHPCALPMVDLLIMGSQSTKSTANASIVSKRYGSLLVPQCHTIRPPHHPVRY